MTSNQTPAGWRDMKDAPRDGTKIGLLVSGEKYRAHYSRDDGGWVTGNFVLRAQEGLMQWKPLTTGFAPVVTEEMIEEASGTFPGSRISASDVEAILTAALPHTKTEAQVQRETIEALALMFELDTLGEENSIKHDVPAVIRAQDSASLALLHAQKGKSDE